MAGSAFDIKGLDGVLKLLQSLPREVVSKRGGPVRAALRKGALVIQKQEKTNLQHSLDPEATGQLLDAIVVTRGKPPSDGKGERYLVRIKRKIYAGRNLKVRGGKLQTTTTLKTAYLKEYGSEKQQAEPFIVPAFKAKAREAIDTTVSALLASIERIVKKLGK